MSNLALAAVLSGYDEPTEVREVRIPEPEPGALIVKNVAATACGTDVTSNRDTWRSTQSCH